MYRELLADATFHHLLLAFDADIADATRAARCALCRGALHSARYPRQPRGRPKSLRAQLGPEHDQRFSFCCAIDGCRSRETPPSLRFLGRKVYLAAIVVLVSIMVAGATASRVQRITATIGVDRRTIERWRTWWHDSLPATPFWRIACAAFVSPLDHARLPTSLLERFGGGECDRLIALLRFLGPVTGGRAHVR